MVERWVQLGSELHGGHSQIPRGLWEPGVDTDSSIVQMGEKKGELGHHQQTLVPKFHPWLASGSKSGALSQEIQLLNLSRPRFLIYKMGMIGPMWWHKHLQYCSEIPLFSPSLLCLQSRS